MACKTVLLLPLVPSSSEGEAKAVSPAVNAATGDGVEALAVDVGANIL